KNVPDLHQPERTVPTMLDGSGAIELRAPSWTRSKLVAPMSNLRSFQTHSSIGCFGKAGARKTMAAACVPFAAALLRHRVCVPIGHGAACAMVVYPQLPMNRS